MALRLDDESGLFAQAIHLRKHSLRFAAGRRTGPPLFYFFARCRRFSLVYARFHFPQLGDFSVFQFAELALVLFGGALLLGLLEIEPLALDVDSRSPHLLALDGGRGGLLG